MLAGRDPGTLRDAQTTLGTLHFRIYTTDDVIGVLLGGALKNVIAIGAGVSDGLGYGCGNFQHEAGAVFYAAAIVIVAHIAKGGKELLQ